MWKKENTKKQTINSIEIDGMVVINPTEEMLTDNGWEWCEEEEKSPEQHVATNEEIKKERENQYKMRSDSLFIAWQKYEATNETEKAAEAKTKWLEETQKIDNEFPYREE